MNFRQYILCKLIVSGVSSRIRPTLVPFNDTDGTRDPGWHLDGGSGARITC